MENDLAKEFIAQSIKRIDESTGRIAKCLTAIDPADIWKQPNASLNSIGNLLLHLCGNIRQYVISALGNTSDTRHRSEEFSLQTDQSKDELMRQLADTVSEATGIIGKLDGHALAKIYQVQGFHLSGIGIIIHVTEHYSYHTGQIAFWTKLMQNKDLGFYANIDLNKKNAN
jgi:uncharacterized damage-inducible protein DinB